MRENPNLKMDDDWGYRYDSRNPHILPQSSGFHQTSVFDGVRPSWIRGEASVELRDNLIGWDMGDITETGRSYLAVSGSGINMSKPGFLPWQIAIVHWEN